MIRNATRTEEKLARAVGPNSLRVAPRPRSLQRPMPRLLQLRLWACSLRRGLRLPRSMPGLLPLGVPRQVRNHHQGAAQCRARALATNVWLRFMPPATRRTLRLRVNRRLLLYFPRDRQRAAPRHWHRQASRAQRGAAQPACSIFCRTQARTLSLFRGYLCPQDRLRLRKLKHLRKHHWPH